MLCHTEAGGHAERRLQEEQIVWMTTVRSDGQPQSVPVWFFWDGEKFLVYSQPGRQKLRNIERHPRGGLNLNSNAQGDVVRVEGTAEIVEDTPPATGVPEYVEKYRDAIARISFDPEGFARAFSVALRVTPTRCDRSGNQNLGSRRRLRRFFYPSTSSSTFSS